MKRIIPALLSILLCVSCGGDTGGEQKITIKVEAPEDISTGNPEAARDTHGHERNVPELVKEFVGRLNDLQPIIENIMLDEECKRFVKQGDPRKFAEYLNEEHSESVSDIADILGSKDSNAAAWSLANHLIRKGNARRRPLRSRKQ